MTAKIAEAFVKAQSEFGAALKSNINPHFKNRYADLASCVEAVIDALNSNGIGLLQQTFENDSGVTVETVFLHRSGEELRSGKLHVPAVKQDPQGYGSALTYARRYSLMTACGIAPEDDDGNAASKPKSAKTMPENQFGNFLAEINAAETIEILQAAYTIAFKAAKAINDPLALDTFTKAKEIKKAALTKDE